MIVITGGWALPLAADLRFGKTSSANQHSRNRLTQLIAMPEAWVNDVSMKSGILTTFIHQVLELEELETALESDLEALLERISEGKSKRELQECLSSLKESKRWLSDLSGVLKNEMGIGEAGSGDSRQGRIPKLTERGLMRLVEKVRDSERVAFGTAERINRYLNLERLEILLRDYSQEADRSKEIH